MSCAPHARATRMPCILPTTTAQILKSCGFPYPITLSMCGVLFSALVSHVALRTGFVPFGRPDLLGSSRFYLRSSLPIGCLSALTLGLGNMAYLHLSVASCQILKTLTPVITLGLGSLLGIERTTPRLAACVMLICLGTMVASQGELAMAGVGVALQLGANLSGARRPPRRQPGPTTPPLADPAHAAAHRPPRALPSAPTALRAHLLRVARRGGADGAVAAATRLAQAAAPRAAVPRRALAGQHRILPPPPPFRLR